MSFINGVVKVASGADSEIYHTPQRVLRGTYKFTMSSSALREFARCPSRWKAGFESMDSKAKVNGSLLDCLLLTPEQFPTRYAIKPANYVNDDGDTKKWNANSNTCKAWLAAMDEKGIEPVSSDHIAECRAAISRLKEDAIVSSWLDACDTQAWVTADWKDEATGLVIPCKSLLDFVPRKGTEFDKCLGDLKTTRNADLMPWQRWCFTAGYHIQAAFYTDMWISATGEDRNTWCFILSENYAPWEVGKRMLSQDFLTLGRATYRTMLENYCQCVKNNRFPSYDDTDESIQGWSLVEAEPFMAERAAFAPKFDFSEPEPEETESTPVNELEIVP